MESTICPNCRQENPPDAAACASCGASLTPPAPPMPSSPIALDPTPAPSVPSTGAAAAPGPVETPPPPRSDRRWAVVAAVVAVLIVVAGVGAVRSLRSGGGYTLPDRLGGLDRNTSSAAQSLVDLMRTRSASGLDHADVAAYGNLQTEAILLMVLKDPAQTPFPDMTSDEYFKTFGDQMASAMTSAGLQHADFTTASRASSNGYDHSCAMLDPSTKAVLCLFKGPQIGFLVTVGRSEQEALAVAQEATAALGG